MKRNSGTKEGKAGYLPEALTPMSSCLLVMLILLLLVAPLGSAAVATTVPLAPDPDWLATGEQQGAEFSYAVAGVGDLDGNGYDEIAVGSPRHQYTVYREGAVFIYPGGPGGIAEQPRWTLASGQTGARFGAAVAGAGDVNGDGFDDLLVGALEYNNGTTRTGAAFLYYGGSLGPASVPDWQIVSDEQGANLGSAVGGGGDVNGDGYDDIVIGARRASNTYENEGAVFLYLGGPSGPAAEPDWVAWSGQSGCAFGQSVAVSGDLDGDGYDDVAVGAPFFDGSTTDVGAVSVFYGATALPLTTGPRLEGGQAVAGFGVAIADAGDVDGDGYDELLVGAPGYSRETEPEGAAFLFAGSADGVGTNASWQIFSNQAWANLGVSVAGAGDLNGDGYDDVLVGADGMDLGQPEEGAAYLFPGSAMGLRAAAAWVAEGDKADGHLGFSVAGAGDPNGDGYADVLVGAPLFRIERIIVGQSWAFAGVPGDFPERPAYQITLPIVVKSP